MSKDLLDLCDAALADDKLQELGPWTTGTCRTGEKCWCRTVTASSVYGDDHPFPSERGAPVRVVGDAALDRDTAEYMCRVRSREPALAKALKDFLTEMSIAIDIVRLSRTHGDAMFARMQEAGFVDKLQAAFDATPEELARAASLALKTSKNDED